MCIIYIYTHISIIIIITILITIITIIIIIIMTCSRISLPASPSGFRAPDTSSSSSSSSLFCFFLLLSLFRCFLCFFLFVIILICLLLGSLGEPPKWASSIPNSRSCCTPQEVRPLEAKRVSSSRQVCLSMARSCQVVPCISRRKRLLADCSRTTVHEIGCFLQALLTSSHE